MDFLIITFFSGIVCFYLGWKLRETHAKIVVSRMKREFLEQANEEIKSSIVNITVEEYEGEFFVYRKDDGAYLAHAKSKTILEDILLEKFPGKMFNVSPEDLEKLESR